MNENQDEKPITQNVENAAEGASQLQAELEKAKRDHLYLLAEFDNFRKNTIKERSDFSKYGAEKFVREFLNVFDNFERAIESTADADKSSALRQGVEMIIGEVRALFQRFGIEEIKAEGQAFDPAKHEALSSEPRSDVEAGTVTRVFRKGYKIHDKLLRPAQVVVATPAGEK